MLRTTQLSERKPQWRCLHKGGARAGTVLGPSSLPPTPPSPGIREQAAYESAMKARRRREQTVRGAGTAYGAYGSEVSSSRIEQNADCRKAIHIHGKDRDVGGWGQP